MHIAPWLNADKTSRRLALFAAALLAPSLLLAQTLPAASTLDRVRSTGTITFGYYVAAKPVSYRNASGAADGYSVALCRGIAAIVKRELNLPALSVQFVPMDADPISAVKDGRIDLLCVPMQPTLSRRAEVSFSIPVFAGGTGVLMRKDAPTQFRDLLEGRSTGDRPLWRGAPQLQVLNQRDFAVIAGTSSERVARQRKNELGVTSVITPVPDLKSGLQRVHDGKSAALLADRIVLLDLARNDPDVMVVNRVFDHTMLALAMRRGDEDFRLLVDETLSLLYRTGKIDGIYEKHLGKLDSSTREWFRSISEPE